MPTPTSVQQNEVLVQAAAATRLDPAPLDGRQFVEVVNNGPNPIWIVPAAAAATPVVEKGKAIRVDPKSSWLMMLATSVAVWAITENANQLPGGATVVVQYA